MEPLAASALRQSGWQPPTFVPDTYMLRVYDLWLDMAWLHGLLIELGLRGDKPCVTGGNYVLPTFRKGMVAHKSDTLERWGRAGAGPTIWCCLPARRRLPGCSVLVEAAGTWMTRSMVVPWDKWPHECLLDEAMVRVVAVGKHLPVVLIPANVTPLPPPW